jgi:hypothetical protein
MVARHYRNHRVNGAAEGVLSSSCVRLGELSRRVGPVAGFWRAAGPSPVSGRRSAPCSARFSIENRRPTDLANVGFVCGFHASVLSVKADPRARRTLAPYGAVRFSKSPARGNRRSQAFIATYAVIGEMGRPVK